MYVYIVYLRFWIVCLQSTSHLDYHVQVMYPAFDYLPPDQVDLYVTNDGSQLPSYVFRQLSEYYHPKDYAL